MNWIVFFLFLIIQSLFLEAENSNPLFIRIIYESGNVSGQYKDYQILKKELNDLGCEVEGASDNVLETPPNRIADINIFIEQPCEGYFSYAHENYLMPNPECFYRHVDLIPEFDKILCRTHDVESIFKDKHPDLYFLGFTSEDHFREDIKKDYTKIWHGPGKSPHKHTNAIIGLWKKRRDFPVITIVHRLNHPNIKIPYNDYLIQNIPFYLSDEEYLEWQNQCGIHLCPSLAEGFGHYIMEAMSTKAIVITTNAPPMNEFIKDKRFLIAYSKKIPYRLGSFYYVDSKDFGRSIDEVLGLPKEELQKIGEENREFFLKQKADFKNRLRKLIEIYKEKV